MPGDLALVQFARAPVLGQVKTRLVPALSPQQALQLHADMVAHTCRTLCAAHLGAVELWVAGDTSNQLFADCIKLGAAIRPQCDGDLGQRMAHAFALCLEKYRCVVLVGSDAPAIDSSYLQQALAGLEHADVVLGPAQDGGYVLVALQNPAPEIFTGIHWGTASVLEETQVAAESAGLRCLLLEPLYDIDRPEDLRHLPESLSGIRQ